MTTEKPLRVVVAGLGNMGRSHALAYHNNPGFEIATLVNRSDVPLPAGMEGYGIQRSFEGALREHKPDVASINTYSDSHADYAVMALEAGCHVFLEKPLATTVADAERVVACAKANGRKLAASNARSKDCFRPRTSRRSKPRWSAMLSCGRRMWTACGCTPRSAPSARRWPRF